MTAGWAGSSHTPYFYGNDDNWLLSSFVTPGEHTFTVRVITVDGQATADGGASVTRPELHRPGLRGATWVAPVTAADVLKSTLLDKPPPAGRWQLRIGAMGRQLYDPTGGGLLFDVGYGPAGRLRMRPTIKYPPNPNSNNGGFCEDTIRSWTWTYSVGDGKRTLTLRPGWPRPLRRPDRDSRRQVDKQKVK